jgi:hypothetical protein
VSQFCSELHITKVEQPLRLYWRDLELGHLVAIVMRIRVQNLLIACLALTACSMLYAQAPPSGDTFVSANKASTNYGFNSSLVVQASGGGNTLVQFNLSSLPNGVTASQLNKATLRLFVSGLTDSGTSDVYLINGAWNENTVTYSNAPPLGTLVKSAASVPASAKENFVEVDITSALETWLTTPSQNYDIALVPSPLSSISASFNSKEATDTAHEPQLIYSFNGPVGPQGPAGPAGGVSLIQQKGALLQWYRQDFATGAGRIGITFDGTSIWTVDPTNNNVTKLRASDGAYLGTFAVGNKPQGIVFDGANLWVANFGDGTVTELRSSDGSVLAIRRQHCYEVTRCRWGDPRHICSRWC